MFESGLLRGKRVLITGGGSGLGRSMGRRFAELGASLTICGRRPDALEQTAGELRAEFGATVATQVCDIRQPDAVDAMFAAIDAAGGIDVLINNAAATFVAQTEHLSPRAVDAVLGVTLHGAIYCTLAAGKRWIAQRRPGTVLSILSTSTITGRAFTVPSSIAKTGLLAMTRSLAVEWGGKGIRLVAIAPGPFPTPGADGNLRPDAGPEREPAGRRNPAGRVGRHIELANLASYLISDGAAYINGEMVSIDGGAHLRTSGVEDVVAWTDEQWAQLRPKR
ncbi:MAG: SDR family oxidoreductase [Burkholderiaceae bacterium]